MQYANSLRRLILVRLEPFFVNLVNQVQWAYANSPEMLPFRNLVRPNSSFQWTDELKTLFEKCKLKIIQQVQDGVCKYDTTRITCLQTDYSKSGLGYLLLQKYCACPLDNAPVCCRTGWKLVYAGSRFTKGAEERYAPTEGELLAVSWALNHAHIFTKGCPSLLIATDHKPLVGILNDKPFEEIKNPRILRLKEHTLQYHFTIMYTCGKWNRGPDALSRYPHVNVVDTFQATVQGDESQDTECDAVMAITNVDDCLVASLNFQNGRTKTSSWILGLAWPCGAN